MGQQRERGKRSDWQLPIQVPRATESMDLCALALPTRSQVNTVARRAAESCGRAAREAREGNNEHMTRGCHPTA
jgi:hypothetical protein